MKQVLAVDDSANGGVKLRLSEKRDEADGEFERY